MLNWKLGAALLRDRLETSAILRLFLVVVIVPIASVLPLITAPVAARFILAFPTLTLPILTARLFLFPTLALFMALVRDPSLAPLVIIIVTRSS